MPYFSIIIPNYNHKRYLEQRIQSVINQDLQDIEIIILDDGSIDNSVTIIRKYENHPKVKSLHLSNLNNGNPFMQWKKGIEEASGEWIWIAESDDVSDPKFLSTMQSLTKQNRNIVLSHCDSKIIDEAGNEIGLYKDFKNKQFNTNHWNDSFIRSGKHEIQEYLQYVCTINNVSATVIKKEIALRLIPSILSFRFHGDWLFYLLCLGKGDIAYSPLPLNYYRSHKSNHSGLRESSHSSKIEHFKILDYLYSLETSNDKKKIIKYFTANYIRIGLLKEGPLKKNSLYYTLKKINPELSMLVFIENCKIKFFKSHPSAVILKSIYL